MKHSYIVLAVVLVLLVGLSIFLRQSGLIDIFQPERAKEIILSFGIFAPLIYMTLYIVACMLFIPGSPLTLAGGAIFGPLYGTIYTVIGATLGAVLAFCTSRYLGRDLVQNKKGDIAAKLAF